MGSRFHGAVLGGLETPSDHTWSVDGEAPLDIVAWETFVAAPRTAAAPTPRHARERIVPKEDERLVVRASLQPPLTPRHRITTLRGIPHVSRALRAVLTVEVRGASSMAITLICEAEQDSDQWVRFGRRAAFRPRLGAERIGRGLLRLTCRLSGSWGRRIAEHGGLRVTAQCRAPR